MNEVILKIDRVSKRYRLGQVGTGTLSHDLNRWWAKIRGKEDPYSRIGQENDRTKRATSDYVDVLKDISFDVKKGDIIGVIGKNGAGKSTLLKIISRITAPSDGEILVKGRIASLLEVGTGMHPEMTAKENIYLNGSILGMTKKEIDSKFNEIIDFAGCAMYLDTPVKRFSSGMRVRLGFAVAAFLEPEILIVDEVLSVGDAEFQKKAVGKIQSVSTETGRTILFVSHNMAAINQICNRSIVLDKGKIVYDGTTRGGIEKYVQLSNVTNEETSLKDRKGRGGSGEIRFNSIKMFDQYNNVVNTVFQGQKVIFEMEYSIINELLDFSGIHFSLNLIDIYGEAIFCHQNLLIGKNFSDIEIKSGKKIIFVIPHFPFATGSYSVDIDIVNRNSFIDLVERAATFDVEEGMPYNYVRPMVSGKSAIEADWMIE